MKEDFPSPAAFSAAAWMLDCEVAAIRAVAEIEASTEGAFLSTGEPTLLFERHLFHRETGGRWAGKYPDLSNPRPGGYGRVSQQHERLRRAAELDRDAALRSASWGLFQILGSNHKAAGHPSLQSFVNAMYSGVDAHLRCFVFFVCSDERLIRALRTLDWTSFARAYNGPGYARHNYHGRIGDAYRRLSVT